MEYGFIPQHLHWVEFCFSPSAVATEFFLVSVRLFISLATCT